AAFTPPRPAPAAAAAAAGDVAAGGDAAALWDAFCEGAGVRVALPQGVTPELLRSAGALLRAAIDGTLQLIAVRAATRQELHAQVTVIQARNNNPLKFSPDAQSALEQLLLPPLRGFLAGPAAVTEAMDDLVGHAIGTMAGTRAALEGVLARFAPRPLEDKLAGGTVIDSVLPMARKAKLWELYLQHHQAIRDEAQEDFHALFGKAFVEAYEQQLQRLRRERPRA
ncbi:MAG TPA: type VI secretion system-associated FHA domain protein TagH, partial [Ramlibacter sp.]|uniref:type VI secretion system-associated FHA domain protein TagH n=1 Tax=Ramlibacter sp. TaxID=1917967 RepID=UPI002D7E244E